MALQDVFTEEEMGRLFSRRMYLTSEMCDQHAVAYPNGMALVDAQTRLTWGQVKLYSDRIALGLHRLGFRKGDFAIGQVQNCVEAMLIRLACEKAGVVYVVTAMTFREAEILGVCRNSEPKGAFIPGRFKNTDYSVLYQKIQKECPALRHIITVNDCQEEFGSVHLRKLMEEPLERVFPEDYLFEVKISPLDTGKVFLTSGSSGAPKCVEWTAYGRANTGLVYAQRLELTRDSVIAVLGPFSAGGATTLAYRGAAYAGSEVVFLEKFEPETVFKLLETERVTGAALVPPLLIRLLNHEPLRTYDLSHLRFILTSTGPLYKEVAEQAEGKFGCKIINALGSGEGGSVTCPNLSDEEVVLRDTVGRPLDGTEMLVVNEKGEPVEFGDVGRMFVKGINCGIGYLRDPSSTVLKWKQGWVDLEELGSIDEQGNVRLAGRSREMIIRGGQNIFPREIEEKLAQHPSVFTVVVVKMQDYEMGEKACAFVVVKEKETFDFAEMTSFLISKGLAKFKIPERLELVEELPLVPGGQKIDKRLLEEMMRSNI